MPRLRFLIVFGPTEEPLDPVRYLSNNSTGEMGRRLCEAAKTNGHVVTSVECPKDARTAMDLLKKLNSLIVKCDVLVMAAAVCDARPAKFSKLKIKKDKLQMIRLIKNPDILANLAKKKNKNQVFIGFGLESENILKNGREKIKKKNLEAIVLQKVSANKNPFGNQAIDAIILSQDGEAAHFPSLKKAELARRIIEIGESLSKLYMCK
jgi:phosphopantothenoylcysteine decarboxylase / phosphopantothenate---cysteine ligase